MKTSGFLLLLAALGLACATTDDDTPPPRAVRGEARSQAVDSAAEFAPPARWWRDPQISLAVNLSSDQITQLDAIDGSQWGSVDRARQEAAYAARDFRLLLNAERPSAPDITAGGERLRDARDRLLVAEVRLVADERVVLTQAQWQTLQSQLHEERRSERDRGGRRGGYGGRGRGGRRPF